MKDITIGQYYPADSLIHRLDPRVKLAATILFMMALFFNHTFTGYLFFVFAFGIVLKLSKVPFSHMIKGLKVILFILVFSIALNMFFTEGHVVFRIWKIKITQEGIVKSAFLSIRLVLLVLSASLMTLTTTPNTMTDGLEHALDFLNRFHVPVHDVAMMMAIALRFIPILSEEVDKIMKAQKARCADFESRRLIRRVKNLVPILVPLLISAFRRAMDLAMAMDSRCYSDSAKRTRMYPMKYQKADHIGYVCIILFFVITVVFDKALGAYVI